MTSTLTPIHTPIRTPIHTNIAFLTIVAIHLCVDSMEAVVCFQCSSNVTSKCIMPLGTGRVCEGAYCYKQESKIKKWGTYKRVVERGCMMKRSFLPKCSKEFIYSCSCKSYLCNDSKTIKENEATQCVGTSSRVENLATGGRKFKNWNDMRADLRVSELHYEEKE
ncbi:hypothetical protein HELRODRAFT_191779 [Helobdella robusta]|uniref:Activin types I and II receptor domain-containing protein n=1 Tax=Helobdella robusta TaxID=6412 RepID=T1FTB4_HELRO|nr:hypothetical protein HELRODRAFT_191779 [Helobdella robusta]ESO04459.1 hypothetical protein HELRODRAFT_191779 [Helobdella robusta]